MGFQEDVEWILAHIKSEHQTALFSATIPSAIRRVASKYLSKVREIKIQPQEIAVDTIEQSYLLVEQHNKLEALTRFLELEDFEAILIFTRTKLATDELAEKLKARGYAAAAMNGDMKQQAREKVIACMKRKTLDIIVATEVAARGLDIQRLTHVINYDMPYDAETYVHRIGRTGRAGRKGKALLLVTPRETRMLRDIERVTRKKLTALTPPSISEINKKRDDAFITKVLQVITTKDLQLSRVLVEKIAHDSEYAEHDVAAALAYMAQKQKPLKEGRADSLYLPPLREHGSKPKFKKKYGNSSGSSSSKFKKRSTRGKSEGDYFGENSAPKKKRVSTNKDGVKSKGKYSAAKNKRNKSKK